MDQEGKIGVEEAAEREEGASRFLSPLSFRMPLYLTDSAWIEHGPFALWLVGAMRPKTIVELGVYSGYSFNTFCQAVREAELSTTCYGIDTWQGDEHGGFYPEFVYDQLKSYSAQHYSGFSRLIRSTFNDAVGYFADGSIDLLHIDGRHLLEDVVNDFRTWEPKLSHGAVVLFHDTNVRENHFGVWSAWRDLREKHRSFEFFHGNGLGVLVMGGRAEPDLVAGLTSSGPAEAHLVRLAYSRLGASVADRLRAQQLDERSEGLAEQVDHGKARLDELEAALRGASVSSEELRALRALGERSQALGLENRSLEARLQASLQRVADLEGVEAGLSHVRAERDLLLQRVSDYQRSQADLEDLRARSASLAKRADEAAGLLDDLRESRRRLRKLEAEAAASEAEIDRLGAELNHASEGWENLKEISHDINNQLLDSLRSGEEQARLIRTLQGERPADGEAPSKPRRRFASRLRRRMQRSRRAELLRTSNLFDADWYSRRYPDVVASGIEPMTHFIVHGSAEGRDPGPYFSSAHYLSTYPDVAEMGGEPVFHFIRYGRAERRSIAPAGKTTDGPGDG